LVLPLSRQISGNVSVKKSANGDCIKTAGRHQSFGVDNLCVGPTSPRRSARHPPRHRHLLTKRALRRRLHSSCPRRRVKRIDEDQPATPGTQLSAGRTSRGDSLCSPTKQRMKSPGRSPYPVAVLAVILLCQRRNPADGCIPKCHRKIAVVELPYDGLPVRNIFLTANLGYLKTGLLIFGLVTHFTDSRCGRQSPHLAYRVIAETDISMRVCNVHQKGIWGFVRQINWPAR